MTAQTPAETIAVDGALIVGAGVAGLFAAIKLAPASATVISPAPLGEQAASAWAQGGVAAAIGPGDSADAHAADTLKAGAGLVDPAAAAAAAAEAADRVEDLARLGAPFARDEAGGYLLSKEAAHSAARVARFAEGDGAGRAIMATLIEAVADAPSVTVREGLVAEELLVASGSGERRVVGALCRRLADGATVRFVARATLLAAGGLAGLYAVTTNPSRIRGQALGMAARAGAALRDVEFVQFHPTAIDVPGDPTPLATEALRGEGAILVDAHGARFMRDIHPDAELAPRDVVARAVFRQRRSGAGAFLDARAAVGDAIDAHFPAVASACRAAGIDPTREPVPVAPAAHYHMGGVATDLDSRSSLPGLFVAGEAAATGLHGANRLASNGLLESLVFASRAAAAIMTQLGGPPPVAPDDGLVAGASSEFEAVQALREVMSAHVGVERDADGLRAALRRIAALERENAASRGFLNMAAAATLVAAAALLREESRGGHFRSDFPEPDPALADSRTLTLAEALAVRDASA